MGVVLPEECEVEEESEVEAASFWVEREERDVRGEEAYDGRRAEVRTESIDGRADNTAGPVRLYCSCSVGFEPDILLRLALALPPLLLALVSLGPDIEPLTKDALPPMKLLERLDASPSFGCGRVESILSLRDLKRERAVGVFG